MLRPRSFCRSRESAARPLACSRKKLVWVAGFALGGLGAIFPYSAAHAAPGSLPRMAGVEAQGPATSSVTALFHNPAMLASMPGFRFETHLLGGLDVLSVRRSLIRSTGSPTRSRGQVTNLLNGAFGGFMGASFQLDPFAIGAGVYTREVLFRRNGSNALRYHLAPDTRVGCTTPGKNGCPRIPIGGKTRVQTDFTIALAGNLFDRLSLGGSVHFPFFFDQFAYDEDTALTAGAEDSECLQLLGSVPAEEPACAERLAFRGNTRLRAFGLNRRPSTRLDFMVTVGAAIKVTRDLTFGIRYRTAPLLNGGRTTLNGSAMACLTDEALRQNRSDAPACSQARPIEATLSERIPQEVAIGSSAAFGEQKRWKIDTNLYWIDRCPGTRRGGGCGGRDAATLSLVGLDSRAAALPESSLYRGYKDVFGVEIWGRYRLDHLLTAAGVYFCDGSVRRDAQGRRISCRPRTDLLFGASFATPGVRRGAITASNFDGWKLSASLGATFRIPSKSNARGSWFVSPGYAVDLVLPTQVGPGGFSAEFDPEAAFLFEASHRDINGAGARKVLQGRGRPTNAGDYIGNSHFLTLSFRWAENR